MKCTFLGTGTSFGIPLVGCDCPVCRSEDPRDARLRASILVQSGNVNILVDTTPDLRFQALSNHIRRVDAVFMTHTHADHIFGMDDLRAFSMRREHPLPVYGNSSTIAFLQKVFSYAARVGPEGTTVPRLAFTEQAAPIQMGPITIEALPVEHGPTSTVGYLFSAEGRSFAYVPDCKSMPESTRARLMGVDVLVLDTLKPTHHPTHMSLDESLALMQQIGATRSYGTHLCHKLGHAETEARLPKGISLAYDGLCLSI